MYGYGTRDYVNLISISNKRRVRGLPKLKKPDNVLCKQCQLVKMTKSSFKSKNYVSKEILEIVYTDLCGPIEIQSYKGDKYSMLFVDDYSRMMSVMFLKQKSNVLQMFKWYLARVEKETRKSLKCLRSDRGGEFTSNEFEMFCKDRGIKRQTSTPRTPPQNGIAERRNRSIMDCARTLMMEKNVALKYWREAVSTAVYTLNRVQVKKGTYSTPFELWYGYPPNVNILRYLGASVIYIKMIEMESLMQKVLKKYFLDTPQEVKLINV